MNTEDESKRDVSYNKSTNSKNEVREMGCDAQNSILGNYWKLEEFIDRPMSNETKNKDTKGSV